MKKIIYVAAVASMVLSACAKKEDVAASPDAAVVEASIDIAADVTSVDAAADATAVDAEADVSPTADAEQDG